MQPETPRDDFLPQRPFPVETVQAPVSPAPRPKQRGIFARYVLPVALFIAIVAVTAWVTQFMPGWRARNTSSGNVTNGPEFKAPPVIQFSRVTAQWDPKDEKYVRPYERGVPGHYDFPFRNT